MVRQRNYIMEFICFIRAVVIVALHANSLAGFNALSSYTSSQVLSRLGGLFASIAGYYFFQSDSQIINIEKRANGIYSCIFGGV